MNTESQGAAPKGAATKDVSGGGAALPEWCASMLRVSHDDFFAAVGHTNVSPFPVGKYDATFGYRSNWKLPDGRLLGATIGGTHLCENLYFLTHELAALSEQQS